MKKFALVILLCIIYFGISCNSKKRELIINGEKVVGEVGHDSIFSGRIKFYDIKTDSLIRESVYLNGILDGETKEYYSNGIIKSVSNYSQGKLNGTISVFDKNGNQIKTEYYYYNLRVGPSVSYKGNLPEVYKFIPFGEDSPIFELAYDTTKIITEMLDQFFFYNTNEYYYPDSDHGKVDGVDLFIYTPNPFEYNFRYSIVVVDSVSKRENVIMNFNSGEYWHTYQINDLNQLGVKYYALKLQVYDKKAGGDILIYRRLGS